MERLIDHNNYEAYLKHQCKKTTSEELRAELLEFYDEKVALFQFMLRRIPKLMPNGKVICLGSRIGEEVQAFLNLGYDAFGIDLIPHPPLVKKGDFNTLPQVYGKNSFDIVYTNAIDHCWEIQSFLEGCNQILKPNGLLILHLCVNVARKYETHKIGSAEEIVEILKPNMNVAISDKGFITSLGGSLFIGGMSHELVFRKI